MRVWLVNLFDPLPSEYLRPGRYAYFARMLSDAGYKVIWWTSAFFHATKSYRDLQGIQSHLPSGVEVKALWAPQYVKNFGLRRLWNHLQWAEAFYRTALQSNVKPDVILVSSPPLYVGRKSIQLGRKFHAKVILDVQDLWPEAFLMMPQ